MGMIKVSLKEQTIQFPTLSLVIRSVSQVASPINSLHKYLVHVK